MSQIVQYACEALDNVEISCFMIQNEPWFKGVEVATVLGYARPRDAVYDHVPLKFKNTFQYLRSIGGRGVLPMLDANDLKASWISEAGLYKLLVKGETCRNFPRLDMCRSASANSQDWFVHVARGCS